MKPTMNARVTVERIPTRESKITVKIMGATATGIINKGISVNRNNSELATMIIVKLSNTSNRLRLFLNICLRYKYRYKKKIRRIARMAMIPTAYFFHCPVCPSIWVRALARLWSSRYFCWVIRSPLRIITCPSVIAPSVSETLSTAFFVRCLVCLAL